MLPCHRAVVVIKFKHEHSARADASLCNFIQIINQTNYAIAVYFHCEIMQMRPGPLTFRVLSIISDRGWFLCAFCTADGFGPAWGDGGESSRAVEWRASMARARNQPDRPGEP